MVSLGKKILTLAFLASCILVSCGGGFESDNDEARNFSDAIFGHDSLRY